MDSCMNVQKQRRHLPATWHCPVWRLLARNVAGLWEGCPTGGLRTNWRQSENVGKLLQGMHMGITFMHNQTRSQQKQ